VVHPSSAHAAKALFDMGKIGSPGQVKSNFTEVLPKQTATSDCAGVTKWAFFHFGWHWLALLQSS
jgi:hypothetical protein